MKTLSDYSDIINAAIGDLPLPSQPAGLYDPIRYTLDGGGKRLRPVLTIATADALGAGVERAINQAIGLEMFHNFTLLHDDVMDNADTRRGRPAVHHRWDVNTAILSGDAMNTLANQLMAKDGTIPVIEAFNETAVWVYEGQQLDMDFELRRDVTVDEYLNMIRLKTAVLIGAGCRIGAMMAGADEVTVNAFRVYGETLGMAFQLQDDYLDTFGDPITFGKVIGGDIVNDKKTWLQIMALAEDHTGETAHLISGSIPPDVKIERMRRIYDRLDLPERCHTLIDSYNRKAIEALRPLGLSEEAMDFFTGIVRRSATRKN